MSKFKIGDRVRRINDDFGSVKVGDIGVVEDVDAWGLRLVKDSHNYMPSNFELAYTPAVGDWVRLTADNDMWGKAGDVGRVIAREDKGERLEFVQPVHGGGAWLVPVNKLEAWAPKVGERVRRFKGHNPGSGVGREAVVRKLEDISHFDSEGPWLLFEDDTSGYASSFEPAPVAAPQLALVIEAGKFYRTRDGRKVLVEHNQHYDRTKADGYPWKHDDGCGGYHGLTKLGTSCIGRSDKDLIAEWPETTNVGAQVDTLAEEYGPAPVATASNDNAAKPRFKVGDKIKNPNGWRRYYTVSKMAGGKVEIDVDGYKLKYDIEGVDWLVQPTAPTVTTTAIVALIEDGQPKPADLPHVHANQAAAEREAKRLAGVHKGKQFGVFVLATTAEEPAPVYAHEWQRLAATGRKIDAIVKLNGLTGIGIKPARDAVEYFLAAA